MDDVFDIDNYENNEINNNNNQNEIKEINSNKEEKINNNDNNNKNNISNEEEEEEEEEFEEELEEKKIKENQKNKSLNNISNEDQNKNIQKNIKKVYAIEDNIDISNYSNISPLAITYPFELDTFQKRGIIRVENHENVLVCAHTSSGKTIVAEYAIAKSKNLNKRIIYTSPIKALSNQKYRDFKEKFDDVGIITGDVSINPDAQCLIMTTEILQNMLYKQSEKLKNVDYIIFDEVHYINDTERGHVWEEILILLPNSIGLVMLSATIPNYFDFAKWIGSIKEKTIYIEITYKRVVPLEHNIYINNKKIITFKTSDDKVWENKIIEGIKLADEENKKIFSIRSKPQGKKERKQREEKLFNQIKSFNQFLMKREQDKYNDENLTRNVITQTHLKIEEISNYVNKENLTPTVMFVFSIKKIDEYAKMLSKTQFITDGEKSRIIKFFDKCIKKLTPEDQKIGQIQFLRTLLQSGVGIHHSGLLPILKEIVEILYSKNLIKILFATTSFSIGLNMPTKSVVFTDIFKFNEGKNEFLSSSEYLQMCGRAGRRGIDEKGYVFILMGDKKILPDVTQFKKMVSPQGTTIQSQFRLSYKTIINFYYRNIKNIVEFFKESYIENSTFISMPQIEKKIEELTVKVNNLKDINCVICNDNIEEYYKLNKNLENNRKSLFNITFINNLLKDKGRIIEYYDKNKNKYFYASILNYYTDYNGEIWCIIVDKKSLENENKNNNLKEFDTEGVINGKYFKYLTLYLNDINDIMNYVLKSTKKCMYIQDDDGFDFYKKSDLDIILTELISLNNLNKCDYLKIVKNDYEDSKKITLNNELQNKIKNNMCQKCNNIIEHLNLYINNKKVKDELELNKNKLKEEHLKCFSEFKNRISVLQKLNYLDDENTLLLKGKASKEITSSDCVLVTELLINNILDKLPIEELIAFLTAFITNKNKINFEDPEISDNFTNCLKEFESKYKEIEEIEKQNNIFENSYNRKIDFSFAIPIKKWMLGKHFNEILDDCEIEEGKVFNNINRLALFFDSICSFYQVLGNTTLGEKFQKAKDVLLREIMTCQSLYLEEDLDIKNL